MWWLLVAFTFYGAVCADCLETVTEEKPSLRVMAVQSVYNVGARKAIFCEGLNISQRLEWYSPSGELIGERSNLESRIYVERFKHSSPIALLIKSAKIEDSGNWTCTAGEKLSQSIEIKVIDAPAESKATNPYI